MYQPKAWQREKVKREDEVINFEWYPKEPVSTIVTEIELSKVVGTTHDSYHGGDWLAMLESMPKRSTDAEYVAMVCDNIDHSQSLLPTSQPITVRQYGDEYIIFWGGNHRICHAKLAGLHVIRVQVEQFIIDPALVPLPASAESAYVTAPTAWLTWLPHWARRWWPG